MIKNQALVASVKTKRIDETENWQELQARKRNLLCKQDILREYKIRFDSY